MSALRRSRAAVPGSGLHRHPAVRGASEAVFGGLAKLRGDRALHPRGVAFDATLELLPGDGLALLAPPLDAPRTLPAQVRLSRELGLPRGLPDFLGIALRVPGLGRDGGPFDLLMTSSFGGPGGYLLLTAARSFAWRWYSSVMPYRVLRNGSSTSASPSPSRGRELPANDRLLFLGALADHVGRGADDDRVGLDRSAPDALDGARAAAIAGTLRFSLAVATPLRPLVPCGRVRVGAPLPSGAAEELRFNPANVGGAIALAGGPLDDARDAAYRASQAADAPD